MTLILFFHCRLFDRGLEVGPLWVVAAGGAWVETPPSGRNSKKKDGWTRLLVPLEDRSGICPAFAATRREWELTGAGVKWNTEAETFVDLLEVVVEEEENRSEYFAVDIPHHISKEMEEAMKPEDKR